MIHHSCHSTNAITLCMARGRLIFDELRELAIDYGKGQRTTKMLCDITQATAADLTIVE